MFMLHTARLLLRDFVEDDAAAIYAMSQEPAVTRYQTWLRLTSSANAREWVQGAMYHNQLQPRQAYNLAIVHGQQVIGWIGWGRPADPVLGDYDFGYALLPAAWGQGFMTESLRAACNWCIRGKQWMRPQAHTRSTGAMPLTWQHGDKEYTYDHLRP